MSNKNIVWHNHYVSKQQRAKLKNQKPCILWFTGLSGSGKSTIASAVEVKLNELHKHTYLLDGDNIRMGLNKGLTFSDEDRAENIRRIGELAKLFIDSGLIVLIAFISPFKRDRNSARELVEDEEFIEIFIDASLEVCASRDRKDLYKKAKNGEILNFTGISSPYEAPDKAEIHIINNTTNIDKCVDKILEYLNERGYIEC